jgi:putative transposase
VLPEGPQGAVAVAVADVSRVIEVTQPTCHRWRQRYGGMQVEEARRLTQLEKAHSENRRCPLALP